MRRDHGRVNRLRALRGRLRAVTFAGMLAAVAIAGWLVVRSTGDSPAPPGTAHVWIDPDGGSCARAANASAYSDAAACGTFTDALAAANDGDSILAVAGTYNAFTLDDRQDLTIAAAPDAEPVIVGDVRFQGLNTARVTFRGFTVTDTAPAIGRVYVRHGTDLLLDDLHLDRAMFMARATEGLVIEDSFVENGALWTDATALGMFCGCGVWAGTYDDVQTTDITVRRNEFHDMAGDGVHLNDVTGGLVEDNYFERSQPFGTGDHVDVIQVVKGADITLRRNEARDWQHGILTTDDAPQDGPDADSRAMIVENNLIDAIAGYGLNGAFGPNSLVANNTVTGDEGNGVAIRWTVGSNPGTTTSDGMVFANNLVDGACSCDQLLTYVANHVELGFTFDAGFELPAGSEPVDAAQPAYAPTLDMRSRPRFGSPDVGALERQGT